MVTVPTVREPSVSSRPINTPYQTGRGATAEAFGAGVGAAMQQAGNQLNQSADTLGAIGLKMQIEDNEREAKRLDMEFSSAIRTIGYGDGTANNTGFYGLRGENALAAHQSTGDQIKKTFETLRDSTKNQRVREMFEGAANQRIDAEARTRSVFIEGQRREANKTVSQARMKEFIDDAAARWNDPAALAQAVVGTQSEVASIAEQEGWGPEVRASKAQEAATAVYVAAIQAAAEVDPMAAFSIYSQNKQFIDGDARAAIEHSLQALTLADQSQKHADRLFAKYGPEGIAQAREEAKATTTGKLRDAVIDRLNEETQFALSRESLAATRESRAYTREQRAALKEDRDLAREDRAKKRALPGIARSTSDQLIALNPGDENGALVAADRIEDPDVRDTTKGYIREFFTDTRRTGEEAASTAGVRKAEQIAVETGGDIAAGQDAVNAIQDKNLREATGVALDRLNTKTTAARKQALDSAKQEAFAALYQGQSLGAFFQGNPDAFSVLSTDDFAMEHLRSAEKDVANGRLYSNTGDAVLFARLDGLPPDQKAGLNVQQYQNQLTEQQAKSLYDGVNTAKETIANLQTNREAYNFAYSELKKQAPKFLAWDSAKATDRQKEDQQTITNRMDEFITGRLKAGKEPTSEEIIAKTQELMLPLAGRTGWLFGSSIRETQGSIDTLTPEQRANVVVDVDEIPAAMRAGIESVATSNGVKLTEHQLSQLAGATVARDWARFDRIIAEAK